MTDDVSSPIDAGGPEEGRSMLKNALLTYATNIAASVLSLANVLIVARVLGPQARGEVAFLITVATISGWVAGISVQEANANIAGSEPRLRGQLATNSVLLAIVFGTLAALVVAGLVAIFPSVGGPVSRTLLVASLATVPVVVAKTYFQYLLQAEYAFGVTNLAWVSGPLLTATANAALAIGGWISVSSALIAWIFGQWLGVLIMLVAVARRSGFRRPDIPLMRRALSFGLKTHPGRLMGVTNYRADQWLVGAISGSRELGLYSVAVAWAELLFYLPGVLTLVQRPDLVRASREDAGRRAAGVFRIVVLLSSLAAIGLIVLAPFLCTLVFGDAFADSTNQLRVLALGAAGVAAIDLFPNALTAQRLPLRGAGGIAVAFIVMLTLDIALIPSFGGMGAATATSVAYIAGGGIAAVIFVRSLHAEPRDLVPRFREIPAFVARLRGRSTAP